MCIFSKPLVYVPSVIEMSLFNGKTFPGERSTSCPVLLSNIVEHDSALSVADVVGVIAVLQRLNSYILKTSDVGDVVHSLSPSTTLGTSPDTSSEQLAALAPVALNACKKITAEKSVIALSIFRFFMI
jgi:hypothetical protein